MQHARYKINHFHTTPDCLVIDDIGDHAIGRTITNDAEWVVGQLFASDMLRPGQRLMYFDSDNNLDEIMLDGHRFTGFAPGPYRTGPPRSAEGSQG